MISWVMVRACGQPSQSKGSHGLRRKAAKALFN